MTNICNYFFMLHMFISHVNEACREVGLLRVHIFGNLDIELRSMHYDLWMFCLTSTFQSIELISIPFLYSDKVDYDAFYLDEDVSVIPGGSRLCDAIFRSDTL